LNDTLDYLRTNLQQQGYFLASVELEDRSEEPGGSVIIAARPGSQLYLREILFEGNQLADTKTLLRLLTIRRAGLFGRGKLTDSMLESDSESIRVYYRERGYLDVSVDHDFDVQSDSLTVLFRISEGQRYLVRNLTFRGNTELATEELLEQVIMQSGSPFGPSALARDRASVMAFYAARGFRDVEFIPEITRLDAAQVDVEYAIIEGQRYYTDAVVFAGNRTTRSSTVNREIVTEPNDVLSLERNLQTERNLYDLAVFNRVEVREIPAYEKPDHRTVLFSLEEAKRYTLFYGAGYSHSFGSSASEGLRGTLGITDSNFLGRARALSLGLRAGSRRQRGNISYNIPRPFGLRLPSVLSLTVDNELRLSNEEEEFVSVKGRPYDSFSITGSAQSEKVLSRRESLFLRYNFERAKLTFPSELIDPGIFRVQQDLLLSSLSLSYFNDSRNDPFNPSEGFGLGGEAEVATKLIGSEEQFVKSLIQGQYYLRLFPDLVFAGSVRLGIIEPFGDTRSDPSRGGVPINKRFFAGGPTTHRGFPLDLAGPLLRDPETGKVILVRKTSNENSELTAVPAGGNALILGNFELRFPQKGFLGGVLFYDTGNVFESITDLSEGFGHALGAGIRLNTPVGPIRFDGAWNPNPPDYPGFNRWNFYINIGHPF
jgi:outer membrane protein assembly complex protein YaeT